MKKFFAIVLAVLLLCNLSTVAFADSDLSLISCPELGFTTMADSSYPWKYVEGNGITIWTESEGYIPFVLVWQSEDLIAEPLDFIKEAMINELYACQKVQICIFFKFAPYLCANIGALPLSCIFLSRLSAGKGRSNP